jgi:hypothetical protein
VKEKAKEPGSVELAARAFRFERRQSGEGRRQKAAGE